MYPFAEDYDYVRNAWYLAAWTEELGDKPLGRTIMDEPVVLYRGASGQVIGIWGLCGHRHFPLADGHIVGDRIVCPYHGFEFDSSGACAHIPAVAQAPKRFRMKTYTVVEKFKAIWIWMGSNAAPDEDSIPPLDQVGFGGGDWQALPNGRTYTRARWPLIIDNLMDLSHIAFLHAATFQQPALGDVSPHFEGGPEFRCVRWLKDQSPDSPFFRLVLPDNDGRLDAEFDTRFFGPGLIVTSSHIYSAGQCREADRLATTYNIHGITPETRHSTHNFSGVARNFLLKDSALDDWHKSFTHRARAEDVDAQEKIEKVVDMYADPNRELAGIGDIAGIRLRRHLSMLMQSERAAARTSIVAQPRERSGLVL